MSLCYRVIVLREKELLMFTSNIPQLLLDFTAWFANLVVIRHAEEIVR